MGVRLSKSSKYCGSACQRAHWAQHKLDCQSPLIKENWRPQWEQRWETQRRQPDFIGERGPQSFGMQKYLWGNMPAIDVLNMKENEGSDFKGPINLLFAGELLEAD